MRLGISSFAFGWAVGNPPPPPQPPFSEESLLDFAIAHQVPVIQCGDHLPLHRRTREELAAFATRAQAAGVAIETGARGLTPEHLERYVALSQRLGARRLRFVIDTRDYAPTPAEITALLRDAVPALRAAGVVLGLENHDRLAAATLRQIVDAIASDEVGVCLDTANSLGAGEGIDEVLARLAPVCVNLHVKDYAIERLPWLMGFTITGRSLGRGSLPLARVLDALAPYPRCTTAVVETWPPPEPVLADTVAKERRWAEESVATLRTALAARPACATP